jgi:hypothetical protein
MLFQELKPLKMKTSQIIIEIKKSDICGIYPLSGMLLQSHHLILYSFWSSNDYL